MKRHLMAALLALAGMGAAPVQAAELRALDKVSVLSFDAALVAAQSALAECRQRGALVAVAVLDRSGVPLVMLRDALAGMHAPEAATRKAWTAISFKNATTELVKVTAYDQSSSGIRQLPNVAMVGGGLVIRATGSIVGGIGVSGAPGGELDEACAQAGIRTIQDALELD